MRQAGRTLYWKGGMGGRRAHTALHHARCRTCILSTRTQRYPHRLLGKRRRRAASSPRRFNITLYRPPLPPSVATSRSCAIAGAAIAHLAYAAASACLFLPSHRHSVLYWPYNTHLPAFCLAAYRGARRLCFSTNRLASLAPAFIFGKPFYSAPLYRGDAAGNRRDSHECAANAGHCNADSLLYLPACACADAHTLFISRCVNS